MVLTNEVLECVKKLSKLSLQDLAYHLYFNSDDDEDEVYCNLCGYGFDTMQDEEHYDLMRDSVNKAWFKEKAV